MGAVVGEADVVVDVEVDAEVQKRRPTSPRAVRARTLRTRVICRASCVLNTLNVAHYCSQTRIGHERRREAAVHSPPLTPLKFPRNFLGCCQFLLRYFLIGFLLLLL